MWWAKLAATSRLIGLLEGRNDRPPAVRGSPGCYRARRMNRTLLICKPDAVERGLVGEIVRRVEAKGLRVVALELRQITPEVAHRQYAEHAGKPFYDKLIAFITRSPSVVAVVEGPPDTWAVIRAMMGATNAAVAAPGTIRGDLGFDGTENLVHGSDSADRAAVEISLFFPDLAP